MAIQLRKTLVGAFMALICIGSIELDRVSAQSDDVAPSSSAASESKSGFGAAWGKMFGNREAATPAPAKATKAKNDQEPTTNSRPNGFQAGFLRPFKAMKGLVSDEQRPSAAEENNSEQKPAQESKSTTRPPARPYREPFSSPDAKTASNKTAETQANPPNKSTATRDAKSSSTKQNSQSNEALMLDPPSIVGTGVPARKPNSGSISSDTNSEEPRAFVPANQTGSSRAKSQQELPQIVSPDGYRGDNSTSQVKARPDTRTSKNDRSTNVAAEENKLPPVAKKPLPPQSSRNERIEVPPQTAPGYAIPNSRYSPTNDPSAANSNVAGNQTSRRTQAYSAAPKAIPANSNVSTPSGSVNAGVAMGGASAIASPSPFVNGSVAVPPASNQGNNNNFAGNAAKKSNAIAPTESRLEMGVPKVRLYVSGPQALQVGKALPYEVILRNEGTEQLNGVIVSMTVPATVKSSSLVATAGEYETEKDDTGAEAILWHVTELQPSQSRIFRVNLEATRPEPFDMNLEWTVVPQTGQFKVEVHQPQLTLNIEGPTETLFNKSEIYRMRVRNTGNALAKDVDVKLTAEPYGSNQSKIGDIPPGGERIVEVELTFQKAGAISIVGEALSTVSRVESKAQIDVSVKQVDLAAQWNTPPAQYLGSSMEYSLIVKNNSPIPAQNVTCVLTLPPTLKLGITPPGCSLNNNEVRWTIPRINPLESFEQVLSLSAINIGPAPLTCTIQSDAGGSVKADASVAIESVTDLKLSVVDPTAPAPVGQDVTYDLVVVNRGTRPATAVKLLAQFSSGIEPVRVEGATAQLLPGQVVFDPIAVIGPGDQITLRVFAQASEPGVHRFRAELECEEGETQLIEEESTRYLATSRTESSKIIRR